MFLSGVWVRDRNVAVRQAVVALPGALHELVNGYAAPDEGEVEEHIRDYIAPRFWESKLRAVRADQDAAVISTALLTATGAATKKRKRASGVAAVGGAGNVLTADVLRLVRLAAQTAVDAVLTSGGTAPAPLSVISSRAAAVGGAGNVLPAGVLRLVRGAAQTAVDAVLTSGDADPAPPSVIPSRTAGLASVYRMFSTPGGGRGGFRSGRRGL